MMLYLFIFDGSALCSGEKLNGELSNGENASSRKTSEFDLFLQEEYLSKLTQIWIHPVFDALGFNV